MAILALALAATPAAAQPLDRVVAVVGDQLVLASDVRLLELLGTRDPKALPVWSPTPQRAIDVAAVRELAGDVSVYAPRPEALTARYDDVRESFETDDSFKEFLRVWGMREADLQALIRRRLVVEQFLRRNIELAPDHPGFSAAADAVFEAARERVVIRAIAPRAR